MKQYKTKKDLPGVKAGTLSIGNINGYHEFKGHDSKGFPHGYLYSEYDLKRFPDFFEEVIEMEKLFTIQDLFKVIKFGIFAPDDLAMKQLDLFISENHPQHIDQLKHLK